MKFQAANIEGGLWWDGMDGRRGNRSLRIGDWEIGEWGKGGAITNCKKIVAIFFVSVINNLNL